MFRPTPVLFRTYLKQHQPLTKRKKATRRISKRINLMRQEYGLPAMRKIGMKRYNMDPWKYHQTDLNTNSIHLELWVKGRQKKIQDLKSELQNLGAQL